MLEVNASHLTSISPPGALGALQLLHLFASLGLPLGLIFSYVKALIRRSVVADPESSVQQAIASLPCLEALIWGNDVASVPLALLRAVCLSHLSIWGPYHVQNDHPFTLPTDCLTTPTRLKTLHLPSWSNVEVVGNLAGKAEAMPQLESMTWR